MKTIPKRIAASIMNSLKGGVVPRSGLGYIAVGREDEIDALLGDLAIMEDGGSSFRILTGEYGSGKSFLLQTVRSYAMEHGFAVMDCDLSPERRLVGTKGQGLATYRELMEHLAVKARPEGGALAMLLERWIYTVGVRLMEEDPAMQPDTEAYGLGMNRAIHREIARMEGYVHGFDFARVLRAYWKGFRENDPALTSSALRWLRGEYHRVSDAQKELGVSAVIADDNWYEYLLLFNEFLFRAGYKGLYVFIDEVVNLSRIPNRTARTYNYEKILLFYNDMLQGRAPHMGFLLCVTPLCLEDPRRGLFSYDALRSRLEESRELAGGYRDLLSPVIRLRPLSAEELFVLLEKLEEIHAQLYDTGTTLTEEQRLSFMQREYRRAGAAEFMTPRELIRDYIAVLNVLYQNPDLSFEELIGNEDTDGEEESWGEFTD